jgi:hypothetical protein
MKHIAILLSIFLLAACKTLTPAEKARREYIKTVSPYKPVTAEPIRKETIK